MPKCDKCGNSVAFYVLVPYKPPDGEKIYICNMCYKKIEEEINNKKLEEY